ncbi:MAG: isoprenyl transferase [Clostridiales bacterium]|nr:isoprenyl transferase [Clostridiales bacterium]
MTFEDLRPEQIPRHVAIILDGNGRWAKANGKLRSQGHKAGADNVETINDALTEIGAKYLTVYAFSTENWKRAEDEVSYLMSLMKRYLIRNKKDAIARRTRIRVIGDKSRLDPELQVLIREVEEDTAHLDRFNLTFAINYGGRDEIVRAVRRVAQEAKEGLLDPGMIDEALFSSYLDTADLPDPDLLIRTSGEERISNFLPWQIAYSELYFAQVYWPDFTIDELKKAILSYAGRERRFGGR